MAAACGVIQSFDHMVLWDHVTNLKLYLHYNGAFGTKRDKMVIYIDGPVPINLHDLSITWLCEIIWKPKTISLLPQCLWPPNLASWWLAIKVFHPWCYSHLWWQTKIISAQYCGHKTRHDGDLPWLPFIQKVKWPYNHLVLWDHVTN